MDGTGTGGGKPGAAPPAPARMQAAAARVGGRILEKLAAEDAGVNVVLTVKGNVRPGYLPDVDLQVSCGHDGDALSGDEQKFATLAACAAALGIAFTATDVEGKAGRYVKVQGRARRRGAAVTVWAHFREPDSMARAHRLYGGPAAGAAGGGVR